MPLDTETKSAKTWRKSAEKLSQRKKPEHRQTASIRPVAAGRGTNKNLFEHPAMSEKKNIVASVKGGSCILPGQKEKTINFSYSVIFRNGSCSASPDLNTIARIFLPQRGFCMPSRRTEPGYKDIDFFGMHINSAPQSLRRALTEICAISHQEDGVTFDMDSLSTGHCQRQELPKVSNRYYRPSGQNKAKG